MNFHVQTPVTLRWQAPHFYPNDEGGYTCTVRALLNGGPDGATLAIGTGRTQSANPEVRQALIGYVPDE